VSGARRIQLSAAAAALVAALAACLAVPAAARAAAGAHSPLASAGIAAPPTSLLGHVMHLAGQTAPDYPHAVSEPASPANYTAAARPLTDPITRIVIHVAEGGWASTYDWFRNPRAEASANYVVSSSGRVAQMVPDRDIAWHAGNWAYNASSIGIEHAGFTNRTHFPDAEYRGSARLAGWIARAFLIAPDRAHVIGHYQVPDPNHPGQWGGVDHHTDPGRTWVWPRYMAYLRMFAGNTYQQLIDDADPTGVRYDRSVWQTRSSQPGRYGPGYLTTAPTATSSPVRFRLRTPAADRYDLLMRWPCGADSSRAAVGVATTGGIRTATVDEAKACGRWNFVGSYALAAGDGWRLKVSSASRARGAIVADAFRLVEQSDPSPPSAPAVTVRTGETSLALSWTAAADNVGVGGYRAVVDGGILARGSARALTVTGLGCDSVHVVSVRALDLVSNLSVKAPLRVRTGACPPPPSGLLATPAQRAVALTWSAPAAGLTYDVLSNGRLLASGLAATARTVAHLACSSTHTFTVESVDANGGVSAPAAARATTPPC
jgi:N-acetyl-anhydromuramyl-L-alanine amidase AmpD